MSSSKNDEKEMCYSCEHVEQIWTIGPGRTIPWSGKMHQIPPGFPLRECQFCKSRWMNGEEVRKLNEILKELSKDSPDNGR